MGCYTQFHANIPLRKDTPDDIVMLIMHAIYDPDFYAPCLDHRNDIYGPHPLILPEHEFFKEERQEKKNGGLVTIGVASPHFDHLINQAATGEITHLTVLYIVNKKQFEEIKNAK